MLREEPPSPQGESIQPADHPLVDAPMRAWLRQAARAPLLTRSEEIRLARLIPRGMQAGNLLAREGYDMRPEERAALMEMMERGRLARERLISANLRLVISVAKRYVGGALTLDDLVQEGNIGLLRAAEKFDYHRGRRFSTCAVWWIRQAITRAMGDQARCIRIPSHMIARRNQVARARNELLVTTGVEPTALEIAAHLGLTEEKVHEVWGIVADPVSFDAPLSEEDMHLLDTLADDGADSPQTCVERVYLKDSLDAFLREVLTERERQVVSLRYGLAGGVRHTLEEVGSAVGVTRERIRQIEIRAMQKLRVNGNIPRLRVLVEG